MMKNCIVLFLVLFSVLFAACSAEVEYVVTGDGPVDISWVNQDGSSNEDNNVSLPWSWSFTADEDLYLSISVRRLSSNDGSVRAQIVVDGKVKRVANGTGDGAWISAFHKLNVEGFF